MASMVDVVKIKSREEEKKVIQKLVDEVRFLGTELARLGRPDDKIQSGSLAGKSLFMPCKRPQLPMWRNFSHSFTMSRSNMRGITINLEVS